LQPNANPAPLASGGDPQPGDFLAAAAGLAPLAPDQATRAGPGAPVPAAPEAPPPGVRSIDQFFVAAGKGNGSSAFGATLQGAWDGAGDWWADDLSQDLWQQDPAAASARAAR
jgi:hypothetical protein